MFSKTSPYRTEDTPSVITSCRVCRGNNQLKSSISEGCPSLVEINRFGSQGMEGHLGIRVTAVGPDFICGEMPVDERTRQPFGLLHGGASIVLAESLGSYGSYMLTADEEGTRIAGVEVSGSHLKAVRGGWVTAVCRPVNLGRSLHVWRILIRDELGDLNAAANLTVKISRRPDVRADG
jgi:1,4-dihydroxy-2-naphthoyl-CoA hydrolase